VGIKKATMQTRRGGDLGQMSKKREGEEGLHTRTSTAEESGREGATCSVLLGSILKNHAKKSGKGKKHIPKGKGGGNLRHTR